MSLPTSSTAGKTNKVVTEPVFIFMASAELAYRLHNNNNNTSICKAHNVSIRAESEAAFTVQFTSHQMKDRKQRVASTAFTADAVPLWR